MTLQDILRAKGSAVYSIGPEKTVADAVRELIEHGVGALLVCQADEDGAPHLAGIVTERDLLLAHAHRKGPADLPHAAAGQCPWMHCLVADIMSTNLTTAAPQDSVEQVMGLMTTKRIRHLPVLEQGNVVGIVSIGDVVKAQHDRLAVENRYMKDYIQG
ncbi:MAG: CBS domain-containing protein [Thermoguttaceae bacterium]|jgi:CBS domain-containing protein